MTLLVAGIDEVGVGAFAGPVVFGLMVVPQDWRHHLVKDSKKFSNSKSISAHKRREHVLRTVILPAAIYYKTASASAKEIDDLGSYAAQQKCVHELVHAVRSHYPGISVIMDGNKRYGLEIHAIPKADDSVPAVAAASVLAKVSRDRTMKHTDKLYPGYHFSKNVGYGTPDHLEALRILGPSAIHRKSVLIGFSRRA